LNEPFELVVVLAGFPEPVVAVPGASVELITDEVAGIEIVAVPSSTVK
jgi:hypothetical protein